MIVDWKSDLLGDRTLSQVYRASRNFPKSKFNEAVYYINAFIIITCSLNWIYLADVNRSYKSYQYISTTAFDLTVQILGFLIGGFAIFATVSDPAALKRLAQTTMPGLNISAFKYVFYNFLSVFILYITTLGASIAFSTLSTIDAIRLEDFLPPTYSNILRAITNSMAFGILLSLTCVSVVRLKSFIWNIYQAFLILFIVRDGIDNSD